MSERARESTPKRFDRDPAYTPPNGATLLKRLIEWLNETEEFRTSHLISVEILDGALAYLRSRTHEHNGSGEWFAERILPPNSALAVYSLSNRMGDFGIVFSSNRYDERVPRDLYSTSIPGKEGILVPVDDFSHARSGPELEEVYIG